MYLLDIKSVVCLAGLWVEQILGVFGVGRVFTLWTEYGEGNGCEVFIFGVCYCVKNGVDVHSLLHVHCMCVCVGEVN